MLNPSGCSFNRRECSLVLPRGLADRGADHKFEDLVFAEPGHSYGRDVIVGDAVGVPRNFLDQPAHRLWQPCVVEGGAALRGRSVAASIQNSCHECFSCLPDV
jgi:hypothetical protein